MDWPQVSSIYALHCDKENRVPSYKGKTYNNGYLVSKISRLNKVLKM